MQTSEADLRYDLQSGWVVLDSDGEASVELAAKAAARIGVADLLIGGHLSELLACMAMRDVSWKELISSWAVCSWLAIWPIIQGWVSMSAAEGLKAGS